MTVKSIPIERHRKEQKMKREQKRKESQREIVTVAEAKKSPKKRSTVATNIQYDRISQTYIVELYSGMKDGKAIRRHETYKTLQDAKNKLVEWKAAKLKGLPENISRKITFGDCIEEFITSSDIERTTERGYRVIQNRIQKTPLTRKKLTDIKEVDIENYIADLKRSTKYKNSTINKDIDLIHRVLRFAVKKKYISQNPSSAVEKLKETKFEIKPLTIEELKILQTKAIDTGDFRIIVPVFLGACQGLRRGEIVGLKWDMIDFENDIMSIKNTITQMGGEVIQKPPKTEKSKRDLEILPCVKKVLIDCMEWQKQNGLFGEYVVVNSCGLPINPTYLSQRFREFLIENNLREIRFHDLRHTFATCAIESGANPLHVSGAMGHSTVSTTLNIYTHTDSVDGSRKVNSLLKDVF